MVSKRSKTRNDFVVMGMAKDTMSASELVYEPQIIVMKMLMSNCCDRVFPFAFPAVVSQTFSLASVSVWHLHRGSDEG